MTRRSLLKLYIGIEALNRTLFGQANSADCPVALAASNLLKSGPQFDSAVQFIRKTLMTSLDPSESKYLGGIDAIRAYLSSLIEYDFLAVAKIVNLRNPRWLIHVFVGTCGSNLPPGAAAMVLNTDGGFWNPNVAVTDFRGGSNRARGLIVLHELCHSLDAPEFRRDTDQASYSRNSQIVARTFRRTLEAIDKASG